MARESRYNPYAHPLRGLGIAVVSILAFMGFLVLLTVLIWWIV